MFENLHFFDSLKFSFDILEIRVTQQPTIKTKSPKAMDDKTIQKKSDQHKQIEARKQPKANKLTEHDKKNLLLDTPSLIYNGIAEYLQWYDIYRLNHIRELPKSVLDNAEKSMRRENLCEVIQYDSDIPQQVLERYINDVLISEPKVHECRNGYTIYWQKIVGTVSEYEQHRVV